MERTSGPLTRFYSFPDFRFRGCHYFFRIPACWVDRFQYFPRHPREGVEWEKTVAYHLPRIVYCNRHHKHLRHFFQYRSDTTNVERLNDTCFGTGPFREDEG